MAKTIFEELGGKYERQGDYLIPCLTVPKNAVSAADDEARYDEKAKRLLGNKIILAHILIKTVDEFKGMNPKDVVAYIEGEPLISVVPVEPGLTNAEKIPSDDGLENGRRIVGLNTENAEINEGLIRFALSFMYA